MKYKGYIIKRKLEYIFLLPFVLLGRIIAAFKPLQQEYRIFFLFPFYHTGGAEKVHALVAQSIGGKDCIIFITRKSADTTFLQEFTNSGCIIKDISTFTDNKFIYFMNVIYRGIISGYINRQRQKPVVFNGQCNFAYKLSPWVKSSIRQIELIHSFNTFSWIRLPFIPFYTQTVMISRIRIEEHYRQYERLHVPEQYKQRITYIGNAIRMPQTVIKDYHTPLTVLYVGRGTAEKRVHLIARIAKVLQQQGRNIQFVFAGDVRSAIPQELQSYCTFLGTLSDEQQIEKVYQQAHILILPSDTEGFPMVVMEAMANGCAILATAVGDIPLHINSGEHGFLFSETLNEEKIVLEGQQFILEMDDNRSKLETISKANMVYAQKEYSIDVFKQAYTKATFD